MITFFAHARPFVGEFNEIQRTAISSWQSVHRDAEAIILGDVAGALDVVMDLGVGWIEQVETNEQGTALVSDIWREALDWASKDWICALNSDNVVGANILDVIDILDRDGVERPFVTGRRWNVKPGEPGAAKLAPASRADWFLFRAGTILVDDIPTFAIGRTLYDNWLIWAAIHKWEMTVIDATGDVTVIHLGHGYPEYGSEAALLESEEKAHNTELFWKSGAPRPFAIRDAPYLLIDGKLEERSQ